MGRTRYIGTKAIGALDVSGTPEADNNLVLGDRTYLFKASASNNLEITIDADPVVQAANIRDAINANPPSEGILAEIDPVETSCVRLSADTPGTNGNIALSSNDGALTVSGANLTDGQNADFLTFDKGIYAVTALDVSVASVVIKTALSSPTIMSYQVFDANGVFKGTLTNQITISGSDLRHDFAGATDVVAGDQIHWVVVE